MRTVLFYSIAVVALLVAAGATRPPAERVSAQPLLYDPASPIALALDYQTGFVRYATVERSDGISRDLYIDPVALERLENGQPLPDGTRIVIEAYFAQVGPGGAYLRDQAGRYVRAELDPRIHVAEKRRTWSLTSLATSARVGDWNFGSFDVVTGAVTDENINECFTCHDVSARTTRDFIFSRRLLDDFANSQQERFAVCNLPERVPCQNLR